MATRMQQRRGTAAQWVSLNSGNGPILAAGEIGFESDTNKFKIGDGVNHWVDLTYFTDAQSAIDSLSSLVDGAPDLLNTLNELAAAIGDDPTFFTTVATNLSNHEADSTNVHGIANTADLATKTYADGKASDAQAAAELTASGALSTHASDTTSVHGITDTAELATKTFAAELLTNATKSNITITGDKNGLTITAENGVADSTTDNLTEGSTNKYFTDERAQDAVGLAVGTGLTYTDATGEIKVTPNTYDAYGSASSAQSAAELTAANALSSHESDTTSIHGIADTSKLVTTDGSQTLTNKTITSPSGLVKADVGLGNVDNTSDANKPVSTATQTALDLKANLAGATFTGAVSTTDTTASTSATSGSIVAAGGIGVAGDAYVGGDLIISGDFTVSGTTTTVNTANLNVADPMIYMGDGNTSNLLDLGIVSAFNDGTYQHTGLVRDASAGTWKLFKGVTDEPTTTVNFAQGSLDDLAVAGLTASSMTIGVNAVATEAYVDSAVSGATVDQAGLAGSGLTYNLVTDQFDVDTTLIQARVTDVSDTEIGYLNGVTSGIQTQLDAKAATSGATFDGDVYIGDGPTNTPDIHVYGSELFYSPIGASASISALDPAGPGPGILFLNGDVTIGQSGTGALVTGAATFNGNVTLAGGAQLQGVGFISPDFMSQQTTFKGKVVIGDDSAGGHDLQLTKGLIANYSTGTSGQVLKSTGTGVEWGTVSAPADATAAQPGLILGLTSTTSTNTSIGYRAFDSNTTGFSNAAFGVDSLTANTEGRSNSAFGHESLQSNTTGRYNSAFGKEALKFNTTGFYNSAFGAYSLYYSTGGQNSAFGYASLKFNTTGTRNNAFGYSSLRRTTTGTDNSAFGHYSLFWNTTGFNNNAFGNYSLTSNTTGTNNNAFGSFALRSATTGTNNNAFGNNALRNNTTGNGNNAFGVNALRNNTTGFWNTSFGNVSMYFNTTGHRNAAVGTYSLYNNTTGIKNTAFGMNAGFDITSGSNNSLFGYNAQPSSATATNEITFGDANVTTLRTPGINLKHTGKTVTVNANTATTIDTVALSGFTTMEYIVSIKQGTKIRSSKVLVQTDGTNVDNIEHSILETGGTMTGINVTASVSSTNCILTVTITDAATTNATVKVMNTII